MKKLFRVFGVVLAGLLLSPFYAGAASAASLTVAVKQVSPDSAAQTVTCADMQKGCSLPLVINAGTASQQSLNIHVAYMSGKLVLRFQAGDGYYYAGDTGSKDGFYNTLWMKPVSGTSPATHDITLVLPQVQFMLAPALSIAQEASKNIAHPSVANLEITATVVP